MNISPFKEEFLAQAGKGTIVPLAAQIDSRSITPLAALERLRPLGHVVLLESCRLGTQTGRYSFVSADPYMVFRSRGETVDLHWLAAPEGKYGKRATVARKPMAKLRELMENYRTGRLPGLPPFTGGAVGFFSYDFVHQFERLPRTAQDDLAIPESCFLFVDMVIAFDHLEDRAWVIVNPGAREQEMGFRKPEAHEWGRLYDDAAARLTSICAVLREDTPPPVPTAGRRRSVRAVPSWCPA